jgi:hypothetical protein
VWAKAVEIELSKYLTVMLRDSLNTIASSIWVSTMFTPFAQAYDKEFSLSANYPKGHGELFAKWMKENYPGELLFHVESTHGSCQDIMFTAALAIAMNRSLNIEFLDYCLRMSDKKNHVKQRSLFVFYRPLRWRPKLDYWQSCTCPSYFPCNGWLGIPVNWQAFIGE